MVDHNIQKLVDYDCLFSEKFIDSLPTDRRGVPYLKVAVFAPKAQWNEKEDICKILDMSGLIVAQTKQIDDITIGDCSKYSIFHNGDINIDFLDKYSYLARDANFTILPSINSLTDDMKNIDADFICNGINHYLTIIGKPPIILTIDHFHCSMKGIAEEVKKNLNKQKISIKDLYDYEYLICKRLVEIVEFVREFNIKTDY